MADHLIDPYYYKVTDNYKNVQKFKGVEFQPLFDNWNTDWEIADKVIWIPNLDFLFATHENITDYLLGAPPNTVIVLVVPHDQFDYERYLRPVLEFQRKYYLENKHYRNQFAIDLTHKVNESFKEEFKDIASYSHDPIFWLTLDILFDFENRIQNLPIVDEKKIIKHFLSLNNRASWDRQSLAYLMKKFKLNEKSYFSYNGQNSNRTGYNDEFDQLNAIIGDVWYSNGLDIEELKNQIPIVVDRQAVASDRNKNINSEYYNNSFCSIVMETFQRPGDPINTEKIIKPIAHKHPFLLYGSDGHLKFLRDLGFETFSDVFDESYDLIVDPVERLEAIFREILRISEWTIEQCEAVHRKLLPRLNHNRNHLMTIKNNAPKVIKDHTDLANYDYRVGYNRLAF